MKINSMPENGAAVRFRRIDEDEWKDGEYDAENHLFIETYATELVTHNSTDILDWQYTAV